MNHIIPVDQKLAMCPSAWAKLLMRCFKIDVGSCPKCGEYMEIIAAVCDYFSIRRYLQHRGYKHDPPAIAPARYQQEMLQFS